MTDSTDPKAPKSSRKKPTREPATIDLKANVVDDAVPNEGKSEDIRDDSPHWEGVKPEETIAIGPDAPLSDSPLGSAPEDAVASPKDSLDSGTQTDAIEPDRVAQDPSVTDSLAQEGSFRDDPMAASPPPPPPPARSSIGALLGTGLLGGLVGAGLVYGLQAWQTPAPQPQNDPRIAQLEQRINALGRQGSSGQPQNTMGQGEVQSLNETLQAVQGRVQALEDQRASLDERLQGLQTATEQAGARAQEALNRPLPEAPPPAPQNTEALTDLSNRLSALETQVREGTQTAANAASAAQALDARLAEQAQSAAERERRVAEQEQRLAELSRQVTEENQGAESAAQAGIRVILAERLSDALRNGTPYPAVLEGLRKAGVAQERLSALEPFAAQGAPTPAALAQSFEPVSAAILRDARGASGAWTDRALRMLDNVVTVRPVNEPGSSGVSSIVARIDAALKRGDLSEASAAWESLPEPSRQISEEWGRRARAAAQANQASQALSSESLAALNRTTQ